MSRSARLRQSPSLRRALKWGVGIVLVLVLLPYLLTPLYLVVRPVSTLMLWRWVTGERVERIYTPLSAIAGVAQRSVIVSEDGRFCSHWGVDFRELQNALDESDDFGEIRGGSTITQQTAKNLFLWPGRSYVRKALEFPLALWMDFVLGKRRVMEIYLNIAEWGPKGQFGIEAGARHAFGRGARELSLSQAALLAAVLPNPVRRDAQRPGPGLRRLAGIYAARAQMGGDVDRCLRSGRRP